MLTSDKCDMKVMEEATKRVKSNALGIGAGSRRFIEKEVHRSGGDSSGRVPRRAKSCR